MSERKHTTGNWELVVQHGKRFVVTNPRSNPFVGQVIACETTAPESVANLTLMAAAPKMLASLEELVGLINRQRDFNDDGDGKAIERAEAAIAKANGGAS